MKRFEVFTVVDPKPGAQQQKAFWMRVGSAFTNNDGSINVILDALPVNGKLQIREPRPREEYQGGNKQQQRNDGDF